MAPIERSECLATPVRGPRVATVDFARALKTPSWALNKRCTLENRCRARLWYHCLQLVHRMDT